MRFFHASDHSFIVLFFLTMAKARNFPKPEEVLVNDLIELMSQGKTPWRKEWTASNSYHVNFISGHRYSGSNIILLEFGMAMRGASLPFWCGAAQVKKLGIYPKKGSKSVRIIRPQVNKKEEEDKEGNTVERVWTSFKVEPVFNVIDLQGEGLESLIDEAKKNYMLDTPELNINQRIEHADAVLSAFPVNVIHGGNRAFYTPVHDRIHMPDMNSFVSSEAYYSTRAHESIHATGHSSRLNRDLKGGFGSKKYALEELIAELGSVLLCNQLQISSNFSNHSAYLQSWIEVLGENPSVLFQCLSSARKAVEFVLNPQEQTQETDETAEQELALVPA